MDESLLVTAGLTMAIMFLIGQISLLKRRIKLLEDLMG